MTGIVYETRLTRLRALRDRLDKEIAAEQRIEEHLAGRLAARQAAAAEQARHELQERRDSVPAHAVRQWAATYGHPYPKRGRVPAALVDQYLDANPEATRSRR